MSEAVHLSSCTSPEVAGTGAVLAVPVGSTEQHGPHLPLSTDTDIAVALATALAERSGVVVAPTIPYGASGEHQGFAGTLSIGQEATELLLLELGRSATETFDRVLFVSTHGGNTDPVERVVRRLLAEGRDVRAWSPAPVWRGDAHAGRIETSVLLALPDQRVEFELAQAGNTEPLSALLGTLRSNGVAAVSANGVLGDPTPASVTEGIELMDDAVRALTAAVEGWPEDKRVWL